MYLPSPGPSTIIGSDEGNVAASKAGKVAFTYSVNYVTKVKIQSANGETSILSEPHQKVVGGELELDCDLAKIDLPDEGKRAGVQAVTAARHIKLLGALKEAKTESEKEEASKKLEDNYRAHYAVETDWRMKRLADLEKRLEEMRAQVKERAGSEDKYVEAAMTLAKLHAQGIVAEPPKLNGSNGHAYAIQPGSNSTQPYNVAPPTYRWPQAYLPPALPGQQAPRLAKAKGVVTLQGKPLHNIAITFYPTGSGQVAFGKTNEKGEFILMTATPGDGACIGTYQVTFSAADDGSSNSAIVAQIPKKYRSPATSGLAVDIKEGDANAFVFEISK